MKVRLAALTATLALGACATHRTDSALRHDPLLLTQEEIAVSLAEDAYNAVAKLRSNFLSSRGRTSFRNNESTLPTVFLDGMRYGPISSLRTIPAHSVAEIRLFRAWEAATQFGTGYTSGVIAVTTRRR